MSIKLTESSAVRVVTYSYADKSPRIAGVAKRLRDLNEAQNDLVRSWFKRLLKPRGPYTQTRLAGLLEIRQSAVSGIVGERKRQGTSYRVAVAAAHLLPNSEQLVTTLNSLADLPNLEAVVVPTIEDTAERTVAPIRRYQVIDRWLTELSAPPEVESAVWKHCALTGDADTIGDAEARQIVERALAQFQAESKGRSLAVPYTPEDEPLKARTGTAKKGRRRKTREPKHQVPSRKRLVKHQRPDERS